ncbi:hypothetical protein M3Y99_00948300 [Aphelenchoides fujianensis]|nr:hypothetical protein M3Y99_00948300 [Aphelenchoides fujianensis]
MSTFGSSSESNAGTTRSSLSYSYRQMATHGPVEEKLSTRSHAYKISHGSRPLDSRYSSAAELAGSGALLDHDFIVVFFRNDDEPLEFAVVIEFDPLEKKWEYKSTAHFDAPQYEQRALAFFKSHDEVRKIFDDYDPPSYKPSLSIA